MPASSEATEQLATCRLQLQTLADETHDAETPAELQQQAEHAIACGIAQLAGEEAPEPVSVPPTRPILAKDLLITVDLVHRALVAAGP